MAVKTFPLPGISWRSNLIALWMVARKDWQHYWRYPLNVITTIFQPLIWLTPVYFMGQAFSVNGKAYGFSAYSGSTDYMSFVLVGMVLSNFVMTVFWNMGFALKWDMDTGVLESNWLTPTSRPILLIGRTLTSLLTTSIMSAAMLLLAALVFGFRPTGNIGAAVLSMLPVLIGLYGFGIAFAAVILMMREANTLVDISSYLVNVFSGDQFPVQSLPRWLLPVSLMLPLTYGYDAVRGWMLNTRTLLPIPVEVSMMVVFMFVMVWGGLVVFDRIERKVRQRGTLGQH